MKHDILLIGTYHKTGTVWMQRVFQSFCDRRGIAFTGTDLGEEPLDPVSGVYLDDHSEFPESLLSAPHIGFRIIRDPRDVVISGAHYHMRSSEDWLHKARNDEKAHTYQQAINAQETQEEKFLFEMHNAAHHTCTQMVRDVDLLKDFKTVRYETWMTDPNMANFVFLLRELEFDPYEIEAAKRAFFQYSLFGKGGGIDGHARSGKVEQWRTVFTRQLGEAFLELNGDALIKLGYEENHDWVLSLA